MVLEQLVVDLRFAHLAEVTGHPFSIRQTGGFEAGGATGLPTFIARLGLPAAAKVEPKPVEVASRSLVIMAAGFHPWSMKPDINKYLALQTALLQEKAKLEARLSEISRVLGPEFSVAATPSPATVTTPGKRSLSEATKAKMRAAHHARWAAKKGTVVAVPNTEPQKRKISPEAKARMIAGAKKRWANSKAGSAPTPAAHAALKKKRKMSAEGKANIRAAVKARWAKVNALKAKAGK